MNQILTIVVSLAAMLAIRIAAQSLTGIVAIAVVLVIALIASMFVVNKSTK